MKTLKTEFEWLKKLIPEGLPYPTSTIISGPGGSGKPLVEFAFVASWLKSGGSLIGIPLQYPSVEFVKSAMLKLFDIDLDNYKKRFVNIQFDVDIDSYEQISDNEIRANLLKPEIINEVIDLAGSLIEKSELGTLVFGSALNLLLFSPTYKDAALKNIETILKEDKSKTYIFSVSNSVYAEEIKHLEEAADNLMFTRMEKPMKLFFNIEKMSEVTFSDKEVSVPISKEILKEIKDVAEMSRKKILPKLKKI